ncbi:MAG: HPr(Ser) kinase/phosphatase [Deltaproteobacteria bacterium]|nr:MAG: HPr(Ser) kinase/phosphatase [Deltaproteobacteria bacterium]
MTRTTPSVTVDRLLADLGEPLQLDLRAGATGLGRTIYVPRIQKPGLALTGYREQIHDDRLLCLGGTEIDYLRGVDDAARAVAVETVMAASPACIVITRGLEPPAELVAACEAQGVPLMVSQLVSSEFIRGVKHWLQEHLAPTSSIHGVLLDVLGVGVLLVGKSGIGKSEAALDLLVRGHRLVADDIVKLRRLGADLVYGTGSPIIRHHMEIRGLGIINVKDLFGVAAVRDTKKIELVIELAEWDPTEEYDRLGTEDRTYQLLGAPIPMLRVPVRPGRSIATIIEVAARNQLLKFMGHYTAREFQERLNRQIAEATPAGFDGDLVE